MNVMVLVFFGVDGGLYQRQNQGNGPQGECRVASDEVCEQPRCQDDVSTNLVEGPQGFGEPRPAETFR